MAKVQQMGNVIRVDHLDSSTSEPKQPVLNSETEAETEVELRPSADSSLARMLSTLNLFSTETPSLTVDQIASQLGVPKSTGYRYVQEMCKVGLLVRLDRSITLGPRIIELDRCIRESDPVLRAATPPMRKLAEQTGLEVFISKLYGLDSIFTFAFPLMMGMISGVYTSLCVSTSAWVLWSERKTGKKKA